MLDRSIFRSRSIFGGRSIFPGRAKQTAFGAGIEQIRYRGRIDPGGDYGCLLLMADNSMFLHHEKGDTGLRRINADESLVWSTAYKSTTYPLYNLKYNEISDAVGAPVNAGAGPAGAPCRFSMFNATTGGYLGKITEMFNSYGLSADVLTGDFLFACQADFLQLQRYNTAGERLAWLSMGIAYSVDVDEGGFVYVTRIMSPASQLRKFRADFSHVKTIAIETGGGDYRVPQSALRARSGRVVLGNAAGAVLCYDYDLNLVWESYLPDVSSVYSFLAFDIDKFGDVYVAGHDRNSSSPMLYRLDGKTGNIVIDLEDAATTKHGNTITGLSVNDRGWVASCDKNGYRILAQV